jgi:hypothetical protein
LTDSLHAFATNTLVDWYRAGADVQAMLPLLSTYMGHYSERAVIPTGPVGWRPTLGFGVAGSG